MPLVHIHISEGKTPTQKRELLDAVTDAIQGTLGAEQKTIRVFIHEFPLENYKGTPI